MAPSDDVRSLSIRRVGPVGWLVGGLLAVLLVLVGFGVTMRLLTSGGTDADSETGGTVVMNQLRMPVDQELDGFDAIDATVWQASRAPEPRFDTSGLGPDLTFEPGMPSPTEFERLKGDVVWLGYSDGHPMAVYQSDLPRSNPWDHLYAFVMGRGDKLRLDATFPCCARAMDENGSFGPGIFTMEGRVELQWIGTPDDTAVVAFEVNGERVGFQRPVGGLVSLEIEVDAPVTATITAMGTGGELLGSEVFRMDPIPEP